MQTTDSFQIQHLNYASGEQRLIKDVSLTMPTGKKVALLGLNGAGKSTLIRLLVGELTPTSGSIQYQSLSPDALLFKDKLGYQAAVMQALPGLSGRDYLELVCQTKQRTQNKVEAAIEQVVAQWRLQDILDKPMTQLSQGNLQKLIISQAFLGQPEYILLDEPTQALDPMEQQRFAENLNQLSGFKLCLFSSHHISETVQTADWVLLLHRGQLIAQLELNNVQQYWVTSSLPAEELQTLADDIDFRLAYPGQSLNLYQLSANEAQMSRLRASLAHRDESLSLLGSAKTALMPLFTLLANEAL